MMSKIKSFLMENKVLILAMCFSTALTGIFLTQCVGCSECETMTVEDAGTEMLDTAEDTAEDAGVDSGEDTGVVLGEDTGEPSCLDVDSGSMCVGSPDSGMPSES